jgi:hypothetical protein
MGTAGQQLIGPEQDTFAVHARLVLRTETGISDVAYWYCTPGYWRAEIDGDLVVQTGAGPHRVMDPGAFPVRYLAMPELFAASLGLTTDPPELTAHPATGRAAWHSDLRSPHGDGMMIVDQQTTMVLAFRAPGQDQQIDGDTTSFTVSGTADPALFGDTELQMNGYYGSLGTRYFRM